jgi:hypothetical protein
MERGGDPSSAVFRFKGQILWIIGYEVVLCCPSPPYINMVCYADDTQVLARERQWNEARNAH